MTGDRDRWFEAIFLQRRVNKLSVPRDGTLRRNRIRWKIGGTLPVARFDDVSRQGIEVTIHNPIGERVDCSTAEMANLEIGSVWRGTFIR